MIKTLGQLLVRRLFGVPSRLRGDRDVRGPMLVMALLLMLCAPTLASATAVAPDDGCLNDVACRQSYDQAVQLFEGGRFEAALGAFQTAYGRRQMPWLLINIGRTLHRLGRPAEALAYYDRYRQAEAKPDPGTAARLKKYTAQAQALVDTANQQSASPPPPDDDAGNDLAGAPPPSGNPTAQAGTPATATAGSASGPTPGSASSPSPVGEAQPIYKKWWFWAAVGGGVAVLVGVGVGVGVAAGNSSSLPSGVPTIMFRL